MKPSRLKKLRRLVINNLPIISADERLKETRVIKCCIFGASGIWKTILLLTLDPKTTLFFDLEAGDLAVEGWSGDTIRPVSYTHLTLPTKA